MTGLLLGTGLPLGTGAAAQSAPETAFATVSVPTATAAPPERPFLFIVDPSLPQPGHVLFSGGLGNVTQSGELRPAGVGPLVPNAGAEVGLNPRVSVFARGDAAFNSAGQSSETQLGFEAGAHLLLTPPGVGRPFRLALQGGLGRDVNGAAVARLAAVGTWDQGPVRLAASVTASHDFNGGADGVDVTGALAASLCVGGGFRAGAEMVVQDLEESFSPEKEGGATGFAGPTLGWEWRHALQLVAGPSLALVAGKPAVLARGAVNVTF